MNERWLAHADQVLHSAGLKASSGRAAVVELLAREGCLVSAQEAVERLRGSASQATVYRALETLHGHGLVHRVDAGDGTGRFELVDPTGEHHHHILYEDGSVEPFEDDRLETALHELASRLGIELTGHEVILRARKTKPTD